jgi:hypothetical protein
MATDREVSRLRGRVEGWARGRPKDNPLARIQPHRVTVYCEVRVRNDLARVVVDISLARVQWLERPWLCDSSEALASGSQ